MPSVCSLTWSDHPLLDSSIDGESPPSPTGKDLVCYGGSQVAMEVMVVLTGLASCILSALTHPKSHC